SSSHRWIAPTIRISAKNTARPSANRLRNLVCFFSGSFSPHPGGGAAAGMSGFWSVMVRLLLRCAPLPVQAPQVRVVTCFTEEPALPLADELRSQLGECLLAGGVQLGRPEHVGIVEEAPSGHEFQAVPRRGGWVGTGELFAHGVQERVEVGFLQLFPQSRVGHPAQSVHPLLTIDGV